MASDELLRSFPETRRSSGRGALREKEIFHHRAASQFTVVVPEDWNDEDNTPNNVGIIASNASGGAARQNPPVSLVGLSQGSNLDNLDGGLRGRCCPCRRKQNHDIYRESRAASLWILITFPLLWWWYGSAFIAKQFPFWQSILSSVSWRHLDWWKQDPSYVYCRDHLSRKFHSSLRIPIATPVAFRTRDVVQTTFLPEPNRSLYIFYCFGR